MNRRNLLKFGARLALVAPVVAILGSNTSSPAPAKVLAKTGEVSDAGSFHGLTFRVEKVLGPESGMHLGDLSLHDITVHYDGKLQGYYDLANGKLIRFEDA